MPGERVRYYETRPRRIPPEFCTDDLLESRSLPALLLYRLTGHGEAEGRVLMSAPPSRTRANRTRLASRRDTLMACVDELLAVQEARTTVERRYLDGHPALFPILVTLWSEQLDATKRLAVVALGLADADGCAAFEPPEPDAIVARAAALVADLVEPARCEVLDELGDGRRAATVARRWLESKLG